MSAENTTSPIQTGSKVDVASYVPPTMEATQAVLTEAEKSLTAILQRLEVALPNWDEEADIAVIFPAHPLTESLQ